MAQAFEAKPPVVRAMLDAALDAIVAMDAQGRILEFNRAAEEMFGYQRDEVLGAPLAEKIVPPDLRSNHVDGLALRLRENRGSILGLRVRTAAMRADGEEFPVELTVTRLEREDPPLFMGFIRDMSRLHRAEEARQKLEAVMQKAQKFESLD